MRLNELGEFGFLARLRERLVSSAPGVVLGSGDDAAVLLWPGGKYLLVTTDAVVEGRHFRRQWLTEREIGERAVRAALSDLAAMGGLPRGVFASLALPPDLSGEAAEALADGLEAGAVACGCHLLGGDLVASPALWFMDVVAVGETEHYWPRSGAQPGDAVLVSGSLGASAAALVLLEQGVPAPDLPPGLRRRFLRPEPAFDVVDALQPLELVTAAIDVSDGLVADLGHIAEASGVQLCLRAESVPVAAEVREAARQVGGEALALALTSGEEYELAFTVPLAAVEEVHRALAEAGARPVTVIGEVRAGSGLAIEGAPPLKPGGWDHFSARD